MSKGNMLLGHARGKVGSLVFSRSNGQQIVRARAEQVKNPQTDAQMIQRILLNTIAQAYSKMSAIVDHSFEGVPAGQKSMSFFMKRNLDALRNKLAEVGDLNASEPNVSPINSNILAVNDYEIAKGSLPECTPREVSGTGAFTGITANTYKAVMDKYGLQRGDQLTFIVIDENSRGVASFKYARVILDPRNQDGTEAAMTTAFLNAGAINLPNPKNENNGVLFTIEDNEFYFHSADLCLGGAMIASRQKEDGTWLRSNSTLLASLDGGTTEWNMQQALDDFKAGQLQVINPRYLNNAGKGASTSGSASVEYVQITAQSNDANMGTVSGGGRKKVGTEVTLTAARKGSYQFKGWKVNGATVSTANPYIFTAEESKTIIGEFGTKDVSGD